MPFLFIKWFPCLIPNIILISLSDSKYICKENACKDSKAFGAEIVLSVQVMF